MSIKGKPTGWEPQSELDHFMTCPVCGEVFDMRKLEQALMHMHDGPESDDALPPEKAVAKEAGRLS